MGIELKFLFYFILILFLGKIYFNSIFKKWRQLFRFPPEIITQIFPNIFFNYVSSLISCNYVSSPTKIGQNI